MASTIKLKNGSGAPLASDLVQGEPALDLTNKRLYTEDSGGDVIEVGTNPTELQVDNINIDGNAITSTDTDGNIAITPNGTGEVDISKVDIDSGAIDNTVIGGTTTAAGSFTTLQADTSLNVDGTVTADGLTVDSDSDGGATIQGGSSRGLVVHRNDGTGSQSAGIQIKNNDREWTFFANDDSLAVFDDTANKTHFKVETGGDISFYDTSGNPAFFWDASAESLGIGTTSPAAKLEINAGSTGTDVNTLRLDSTSGGAYNILCSDASSATPTWKHSTGTSEPIEFIIGGTSTMRLGTGKVGIGTSSPDNVPLHIKKNGNRQFLVTETTSSLGTHEAGWRNRTGSSYYQIFSYGDTNALIFRDNNAATERMRIDSSGNVGIGTSSPVFTSGGGLQVHNSTVGRIRLTGGNSGTGTSNGTEITHFNSDSYVWNYENGPMQFGTNNTERMRIDSSGNLLVGTTDNFAVTSSTATGFKALSSGMGAFYRDGGTPLYISRGEDGTLVDLRQDGAPVGSIDAFGNQLNINGGTSSGLSFGSSLIYPRGGSNTLQTGTIDLGNGTNRFRNLYLSGGINFGNAGSSGTATSNLLDDYEEGTWTPALQGVSASTNAGTGNYIKIGKMVFCRGYIAWTGLNTSDASAFQFNLPFTSDNSDDNGTSSNAAQLTINSRHTTGFTGDLPDLHGGRVDDNTFYVTRIETDFAYNNGVDASGEFHFHIAYRATT